MRAVAHVDALPPIAVTQVGPVLDIAIVHEHDVLKPVPRHVTPFDARVGEVHVGKLCQGATLEPHGPSIPPFLAIIKEALQARSRSDHVGDAVSIEVNQFDFGVFQIKARRTLITSE